MRYVLKIHHSSINRLRLSDLTTQDLILYDQNNVTTDLRDHFLKPVGRHKQKGH